MKIRMQLPWYGSIGRFERMQSVNKFGGIIAFQKNKVAATEYPKTKAVLHPNVMTLTVLLYNVRVKPNK